MHPDLKALRERINELEDQLAEVLLVQRLREHEERITVWEGYNPGSGRVGRQD